jgi:hypothetical protein
MSTTLTQLAMRFELRSMSARLRLQRAVQRQQREDALLCEQATGWLEWHDRAATDPSMDQKRRWIEQSEIGMTRIKQVREQHETERNELAAEWEALDETTRLLNRVASRRARRNTETGGEE